MHAQKLFLLQNHAAGASNRTLIIARVATSDCSVNICGKFRASRPECVRAPCVEPRRAATGGDFYCHAATDRRAAGRKDMLWVRLTHHERLRLSGGCCFLEIYKTGRTLSGAERAAREASGLPGQPSGRDI